MDTGTIRQDGLQHPAIVDNGIGQRAAVDVELLTIIGESGLCPRRGGVGIGIGGLRVGTNNGVRFGDAVGLHNTNIVPGECDHDQVIEMLEAGEIVVRLLMTARNGIGSTGVFKDIDEQLAKKLFDQFTNSIVAFRGVTGDLYTAMYIQ